MFALNESPLTTALKAVKPTQNALIAQRNYLAVKALHEQIAADVAAEKQEQQRRALREHARENERLDRAHDVMIVQAKSEAARNVESINARSHETAELHRRRQERALAQYEEQVRASEMRRPLVYSSTVRDLLAAEEHLVRLGQWEDAAATKRKIGAAAEAERKKFRAEQERRIAAAIARRKQVLAAAAEYAEARRRNEVSMAAHRAHEQVRLLDEKFAHCADDMQHAQRIELSRNPLLLNLQCPPAMRRRKELAAKDNGAANSAGVSSVMAAKSTRGTQQLRNAVGSRYEVPSLCDSYGSLVEASSSLPHCASRSVRGEPTGAAAFFAHSSFNGGRASTARAATAPGLTASDLGLTRYGLVGAAADHDAGEVY